MNKTTLLLIFNDIKHFKIPRSCREVGDIQHDLYIHHDSDIGK